VGRRAVPILAIGFSVLISLIALTGVGALHRSAALYKDFAAASDRYRQTDEAFQDLAKGIYIVGLLARDYLLDRSNAESAQYRQRVVVQCSIAEQDFRFLNEAMQPSGYAQNDGLRSEIEEFCAAMNPIFEWTPAEKAARSSGFLRTEILPRREAALSLAHDLTQLTRASLQRQRRDLDRRHDDFMSYVRHMLGGAVLIGLGIAILAILWVGTLEANARRQFRRIEAAEDELRRLSRQQVRAQEEERKSISRDLHDEVGQSLTALRMELRSIQDHCPAPEPEFTEHVERAKRLTEQTLRVLRHIAMGLRPTMLDDLGLGPAVQWQGREFSRQTGVPVNITLNGIDDQIPERQKTCAYRLVQEGLTNCARHSKATAIDVTIERSGAELAVRVKDNGVGFDPADGRDAGRGLLGIQERVKELGGQVRIEAQPRAGTAVYAVIPLDEEKRNNGDSDSAG
jgi:signal transduction histidine kinase